MKQIKGVVEIRPILRGENKAFYLSCEINKNGQAKTPASPPPHSPISNGGGSPTGPEDTTYGISR